MDKVESQDLDSTISDDSVDREDKRILDSMSGLLININNIIGVGIYSTPGIVWEETRSVGLSLILWILDSIDELKAPENKLMNSNRYSVIIVDIFTNIAYISVVPRELVIRPEQNPNEVIAGQFAMIVGGEIFGRILAFLISISALGVMAVLIWSGSRVIVAAAKHNYIPVFSHLLKQWHPTYNTPVYALGAHSWIYYTLSAIGLFVLRKLDGDGYNLYKVSTPLIYMFIMAGMFIVAAPFFTPDTQYYSENYNNSISNTTLPSTTSDLNCPLNTKDSYPYYIPYLVSIVVIFIGIICWYFDGVYRRFQLNQNFYSNNDRRDRRNDGQEDKDLQQQQQDNDRIDVDEIRISTK
nr:899_t:CDS:2 [Entrophospora candida]